MTKIYRSLVGKHCSWKDCKRPAHAHVDGKPYCSTHRALASHRFEVSRLHRLIRAQAKLINTIDTALVEAKTDRDLRNLRAIATALNHAASKIRRVDLNGLLALTVYKRKFWIKRKKTAVD